MSKSFGWFLNIALHSARFAAPMPLILTLLLTACSKQTQPTLAENVRQTKKVSVQAEATSTVGTTLVSTTDAATDEETLALIIPALRKGFDLEKDFCSSQQISGNDCDAAFGKVIKFRKVKLNPNGQEGVAAELEGPGFCGSGGCMELLLRRTTQGYEREEQVTIGGGGQVTIGGGGLEILGTTTNGYYDLISHGEKRYNAPDFSYKWDGEKYVEARRMTPEGAAAPVGNALQPSEPSRSSGRETKDLFAPFLGKWIGYTCSTTDRSDPSYRVIFYETESIPRVMFTEVVLGDGHANATVSLDGTRSDQGFLFHRDDADWYFLIDKDGILTGSGRWSTKDTPSTGIFLRDNGQDLVQGHRHSRDFCDKWRAERSAQ